MPLYLVLSKNFRRRKRRKILLSTRYNGIFFALRGGGSIAGFSPQGGGRLQDSGRKVVTGIPDNTVYYTYILAPKAWLCS